MISEPQKVNMISMKTVWWQPVYSVQFSHSVVCNTLQHHELQYARPPCPSPISGVHTNPYPLSQWCHPIISFPVVPFSSCPQSFPASGSFQMSQLFASGGQRITVSASTSVLLCLSGNGPHLAWRWEPSGFSRIAAGALDLWRGPQGPALVASGEFSPHASCSGASWDSSPVNIGA